MRLCTAATHDQCEGRWHGDDKNQPYESAIREADGLVADKDTLRNHEGRAESILDGAASGGTPALA